MPVTRLEAHTGLLWSLGIFFLSRLSPPPRLCC